LLLCSSYLPLGVPNWTVLYIINTVPHHGPWCLVNSEGGWGDCRRRRWASVEGAESYPHAKSVRVNVFKEAQRYCQRGRDFPHAIRDYASSPDQHRPTIWHVTQASVRGSIFILVSLRIITEGMTKWTPTMAYTCHLRRYLHPLITPIKMSRTTSPRRMQWRV
jgi:hypothetical protein